LQGLGVSERERKRRRGRKEEEEGGEYEMGDRLRKKKKVAGMNI
jgi:hypothetical protein